MDYRDSPFIATTPFSSFVVPAPGMGVYKGNYDAWTYENPHPSLMTLVFEPNSTQFQSASYFDINDILNYEKEKMITPLHAGAKEKKKITSLSEAGQKGGAAPKKNPAILEALRIYLEKYPTKLAFTNEVIKRTFIRKYNGELNACIVEVNGSRWEVFFYDNHIFTRTGKKKERSIMLSTLPKYISTVKKIILENKSNNPS